MPRSPMSGCDSVVNSSCSSRMEPAASHVGVVIARDINIERGKAALLQIEVTDRPALPPEPARSTPCQRQRPRRRAYRHAEHRGATTPCRSNTFGLLAFFTGV